MLFESSTHLPAKKASEFCVEQLALAFNQCFAELCVELSPGAQEPFYRASSANNNTAVIYSTHDYFSSALHEVAHWCIAGEERRKRDDYGYWYEPDGRNAQQQTQFFQVESKPQALEWAFSLAAGVPFRVSLDNLDKPSDRAQSEQFREHVYSELENYFTNGFPPRAATFIALLCSLYRFHQPIKLPLKASCLL